jgi:integrase
MAGGFIQRSRHGTVFYFRRRIPRNLRDRFGRAQIYLSLRTEELAHARRLARELAVATDRLFLEVRYMPQVHQADRFTLAYGLTVERDERGNLRVKVDDAKAGDEASIEDAAKRVLGLATPSAGSGAGAPTPTVREAAIEVLGSLDIKPLTTREYRRVFDHFAGYVGPETHLGDIKAERFAAYAAHVRARPGWSPKTQALYITAAQRLFTFYASRSSAVPQLKAGGLKPRRAAPEALDRAAYTLQEIEVVFKMAFRYRFTEPAKWWVTVASAFMGTRIEELCQAHLDGDFATDAETGIAFLYVDETTRGRAPFKKSVKTHAGWRKVPIHPSLVKAGFNEFLDAERKAGSHTPFQRSWAPLLGAEGRIKHSHYVSRWGGKALTALREQGAVGQDVSYFHSMRHTFTTLLSKADISEEWRAALCGQSYGGINARTYDKAKQDVAVTLPKLILGLKPLEDVLARVLKETKRNDDEASW